ncbi:MAG: hypothetical protein WBX03_03125 [Terriglobales bacterium]
MLKSFAFRCFAALLILTAAAGVAMAQSNPVAVQQQLFDALAQVRRGRGTRVIYRRCGN